MLIDASKPVGRGDEWVAAQLDGPHCKHAKKICVLSKGDLVTTEQMHEQAEAAKKLANWDAMVGLSSESGYNVDAFIEEVQCFLPEGPAWFPADMETDQPIEVIVAEFIREKILRSTFDEVPHSVGVVVEDIERVEDRRLMRIWAVIYVERDSQKGIIIGAKGSKIKQIGMQAREDLERIFGCQVHLDLTVKVKKDWRQNAAQVRKFGYGEGL